MRIKWLLQNKSKHLLVFYAGWGMDSTPFRPIPSDSYDILICYDYSDKSAKPDIHTLSRGYEKSVLLCWSMGVVYGQLHFIDNQQFFEKSIALNGTLAPVDDQYGIPHDIYLGTLENMCDETLQRFYKRMCRPADILQEFLKNKPQRSLVDQHNELQAIYDDRTVKDEKNSIFSHIIISDRDRIVPTTNQLRYWQNSVITTIQGCHFPFYEYSSWDELIDRTEK